MRIELLNNLLKGWQRNENVDQIYFAIVILAAKFHYLHNERKYEFRVFNTLVGVKIYSNGPVYKQAFPERDV